MVSDSDDAFGVRDVDLRVAKGAASRRTFDTVDIAKRISRGSRHECDVDRDLACLDRPRPTAMGKEARWPRQQAR